MSSLHSHLDPADTGRSLIDLVIALPSTDSENEHISSILLQRARALAAEHTTLSAANAENYSIAAAKKLGELGPICTTLKEWDDAHNVR